MFFLSTLLCLLLGALGRASQVHGGHVASIYGFSGTIYGFLDGMCYKYITTLEYCLGQSSCILYKYLYHGTNGQDGPCCRRQRQALGADYCMTVGEPGLFPH
jgi:hypothetical protein